MIPLIRHYLWAFFFDQNAAKRLLIGFAALVANVVVALAVFGIDTIMLWNVKTFWQHVVFALMSTLATMLPGPKIEKPDAAKLLELKPPRGFITFLWVTSISLGVIQALVVALALHSLGANNHVFALVAIAAGGAQGWAVWKALK